MKRSKKLKTIQAKWFGGWTESVSFKSLITRAIFTIILVTYFCYTIYSGPILIINTTVVIQMKCYSEIINIGYDVCKMQNVKWYRALSWYFLIVVNYYCYCQNVLEYFVVFIEDNRYVYNLIKHHEFISLLAYVVGMIIFVLHLGKTYDKNQFSILAWTHVTLLMLVTQSYMIVKNVFHGLIWLCLPVSIVVLNDIMAYLFGKRYGKTPLIALSPKKTREGFVFGGLATILSGLILSYVLCQYEYFICPIEYKRIDGVIRMIVKCEPSYLFQMRNYPFEIDVFNMFIIEGYVNMYPFLWHAFCFVTFASVIAPFGGFFASGFKRAFGVKDFGNFIPGHGGLLDRFDCQFLMATFINVYISSFIKNVSIEHVFDRILNMKDDDQLKLFYSLETSFKSINDTQTIELV